MKSSIFLIVLIILLSTNCLASDPPYAASPGEIIFFTETAYEDPIIVTCSLSGVVFDQDATWNASVPGGHPQYNVYTHYGTNVENNKLAGSTNALTRSNGLISWESVYENDDAASAQNCTGMLGWGKYTFFVGNENEDPEIIFTVNTTDGRWMYSADPNDAENKFIFKVERETSGISVYLYNWNTDQWDEITFGENITFWENNASGSRYRDGLDPASTVPFTLSISQGYPLECDIAVLDVPLECSEDLLISPGKTLEINDYLDDYTGSYTNTILRFEPGTGVIIDFENNPNILTTLTVNGHYDDNFETVILASSDFSGSPDQGDAQWEGLKAYYEFRDGLSTPSSYNINMQYCAVLNANSGLYAALKQNDISHYLELGHCRIWYSAANGIRTSNSALYLHESSIEYALIGIEYSGYTYDLSCPNRIEQTHIYYSELYGIQVTGHGKSFSSEDEPNRLEIAGNHIYESRRHGIWIRESLVAIMDNAIEHNGWTGASETIPYGYCGLWSDASHIAFHGNLSQDNTAYGLQADNVSLVHGNYLNYSSPSGSAASCPRPTNCYMEITAST